MDATHAPAAAESALEPDYLGRLDAYWRAANYLSVGQIYLLDNPLLTEPLRLEHVKPRLLGHWGTSPGLNFIYAHLNRVIRKFDLDMIYIAGPGHGGPALVANAYLEGTYSEYYPEVTEDVDGLRRLFRQFSFPGGIPSHVAPETPGSIHEGGELGYALSHAYGAVFDNPELIVACVIGDGEAETGPLATSWHSNKFVNPVRDGAVLPILHLNGYKIAGPTVLARIPRDGARPVAGGMRVRAGVRRSHSPMRWRCTASWRRRLDHTIARIRELQSRARSGVDRERPRWPMLVLSSPKGWTGPDVVDGDPVEGTWRSHQVPLAKLAEKPKHLRQLEEWMRSYRPQELFTARGAASARAQSAGAGGPPAHERQPARKRRHAAPRSAVARFPRVRGRGRAPGGEHGRGDARPGRAHARRHAAQRRGGQFPHREPRRAHLESLGRRARGDLAHVERA